MRVESCHESWHALDLTADSVTCQCGAWPARKPLTVEMIRDALAIMQAMEDTTDEREDR